MYDNEITRNASRIQLQLNLAPLLLYDIFDTYGK